MGSYRHRKSVTPLHTSKYRNDSYPDSSQLAMLCGNPAEIEQLTTAFIHTAHTDLVQLELASRSADTRATALILHRLLGGLCTFGNSPVLDHGRRCLKDMTNGQLSAVDPIFADLQCRLHDLIDHACHKLSQLSYPGHPGISAGPAECPFGSEAGPSSGPNITH